MTTVGLMFGGVNSEHEVSLASARAIAEALDGSRFSVRLIGIDRSGRFREVERVDDLASSSAGARFPELDGIDVVFPALHGRYGEDGTVQGLLELAGVPYVGAGVLAGALAMDKRMTGRVLAAAGVPVVSTRSVGRHDRVRAAGKVAALGYPAFVKPNRAGSSVGATRVDDESGLASAVSTALAEDGRALLQPLVAGEEVDVGILELPDGRLVAGAPLRIRPSADSPFFDYEAKYSDGGAEFEVPAVLDPDVTARLIELAERSFRALGCAGLARVDFFLADDGSLSVNEVNTMPGLTAHSQYPRMFRAIGMSFPDLLETLIETASPSVLGGEDFSVAARAAASARGGSARAGSS